MIYNTNYNLFKYKVRYFLLKYIPEFLYPFVFDFFYKQTFGEHLNLKNPKKLSEKILYYSFYNNSALKTRLTDKLLSKEYVSKILPELNIAKVYQTGTSFDELDFSKAPNAFIIKTNHAWKSHILVQNKNQLTEEEYQSYKKYYKDVLSINYAYWGTPELQYKNIKNKVYLEEYLYSNDENRSIKEYEVYCLNSEPEFISYSISYSGSADKCILPENKRKNLLENQYLDANWNKVDFEINIKNNNLNVDTPNKEKIIDYARVLSTGFKFVRIDFFEVNDKLYFGEFTFTPHAGFLSFHPEKYDDIYGEKLSL